MALCMASSLGDSYKFTYKVTRLTLETVNTFNVYVVSRLQKVPEEGFY
jgi:hypothetical protein